MTPISSLLPVASLDAFADEQYPIGHRIALLAQVAEVFHAISGPKEALEQVKRRSDTWFDPSLVQAFECVAATSDL